MELMADDVDAALGETTIKAAVQGGTILNASQQISSLPNAKNKGVDTIFTDFCATNSFVAFNATVNDVFIAAATITAEAHSKGYRVVAVNTPSRDGLSEAKIGEYNLKLNGVGADGVVDLYTLWGSTSSFSYDGIHPTEKAQTQGATAIAAKAAK